MYLRELEDRHKTIINSINEQGKLTLELNAKLLQRKPKRFFLEDLYLPYKPKKPPKVNWRLQVICLWLSNYWQIPVLIQTTAESFILKAMPTLKAVLDGAKYILMERFAEDAELLAKIPLFLSTSSRY